MGSGLGLAHRSQYLALGMIRSQPSNLVNIIIKTALDLLLSHHESATNILTQKWSLGSCPKSWKRMFLHDNQGPSCSTCPAQPTWEYWLGRIAGRSMAQWSQWTYTFPPETLLLAMEIRLHLAEWNKQLSFTDSAETVVFNGLTTKP